MGETNDSRFFGWGGVGLEKPWEGEAEFIALRSMRTAFETIAERVDHQPCYATIHDAPLEWGVLALSVCGLPVGHEGPHRAGWTGTGKTFTLPSGIRTGTCR